MGDTVLIVELKERMRALRVALKLTQEQLADRGELERVEISNLESGRNQATSTRILKGLAKGFELSLQDMADVIDGALSVDEAVRRRGSAAQARAAGPHPNRALAADLARADGIADAAIASVLAESVAPDDAGRSVLWWARRMKFRENQMEVGEPSRAPDHESGVMRVRKGPRVVGKKT